MSARRPPHDLKTFAQVHTADATAALIDLLLAGAAG
jgi:hypothetical protein